MINLRRMAIATGIAILINLVIYAIGSAAGATWLANGQTIAWFLVVAATIIPMVIGAVATWLLEKRWAKATTGMAWIGLIFGLVTVPAPLLSSSNGPTGVALAAMHVSTGVTWFLAVRPRRSPVG